MASGMDESKSPAAAPIDIEQLPAWVGDEEKYLGHGSGPASLSPVEGKEHDESTDVEPGPVMVPRLKRRGLFGQFTLLAEVENPKAYSRKTKWFITFIVAVAGATAPMGSSIFFRK